MTQKMPSLIEFYDLLDKADWSYEMSDDQQVWRRGIAEMSMLATTAKIGGKEYQDLLNAMRKHFWSPPKYSQDGTHLGREIPKPPRPN